MNKDFLFGAAVGFSLAMIISMGIFYGYVVNKIDNTKKELKETMEVVQESWEKEWKNDVQELKEAAKKRLTAEGGDAIDNLKDKVSEYWQNRQTDSDSTATE